MSWLISAIAGFFLRWIGAAVTKAIIWKAFISTLVIFILPVVLFKLFTRILSDTMDYAFNVIDESEVAGVTVQLAGMGAWVAQQINLSGALSIFLSALALKFTLGMVSSRLG